MQCFHSMAAHNLNVSLLMMLLSTLSQPPQAPSQTVDFVKIVTCHPVIISFHSDHHFSSFQLMFSPLLVPMIFDSLSHLKTWSLRLQGQYLYCICIHLHRSSPLPISLIIYLQAKIQPWLNPAFLYSISTCQLEVLRGKQSIELIEITSNCWPRTSSGSFIVPVSCPISPVTMSNVWEMLVVRVYVYSV